MAENTKEGPGFELHETYQKKIEGLMEEPGYQQSVQTLLALIREDPEKAAQVWALDKIEATRDILTDTGNRKGIFEVLERKIAERERDLRDGKKASALSVVFIDLDHLKEVNDGKKTLGEEGHKDSGHHVGDEYLKSVAQAAKEAIRDIDYVGRLGGDEFVVVLDGANTAQAINISGRVRQKFDQLKKEKNLPAYTSISIGVSQYESGQKPEALLNNADVNMYRQKEGHKPPENIR
jgi:diguanylate cyclase (GGDEF)-like protein